MVTVAAGLRPDEFSIFLDNTKPLAADGLAAMLEVVARLVRQTVAEDARLEVVELKIGSFLGVFRVATGNRAGVVYGFAALVVALQQQFGSSGTEQALAQLLSDSDVREIVITTRDETIHVERTPQAPAVLVSPKDMPLTAVKLPPFPPRESIDSVSEAVLQSIPNRPRGVTVEGTLYRKPLRLVARDGSEIVVTMSRPQIRRNVFGIPVIVSGRIHSHRGKFQLEVYSVHPTDRSDVPRN